MSRRIHISDHAMLRYIERVLGLDLTPHRAEIARIVAKVSGTGAHRICSGGFTYEIADASGITVVKTIMPGSTPNAARAGASRHNFGRSVRMQRERV